MSYLFGPDDSLNLNGLGCGPSCGCGPCRAGSRNLGEWYIKDDEEDAKPAASPKRPATAVSPAPAPSSGAVSGWATGALGQADSGAFGYGRGGYFAEAPAPARSPGAAPQRPLLAHPQVIAQLPDSGPGYYTYYATDRRGRLDSPPGYHRYARPEVIRAIQWVGTEWQRTHPRGPRIGVGDLSLLGGGPTPRHGAHQRCLEVDLRPLRLDGRELSATFTDPQYSRALTEQLVMLIRRNPIARVRVILFNDPAMAGVKAYPNHNNHLHVGFLPAGAARRS